MYGLQVCSEMSFSGESSSKYSTAAYLQTGLTDGFHPSALYISLQHWPTKYRKASHGQEDLAYSHPANSKEGKEARKKQGKAKEKPRKKQEKAKEKQGKSRENAAKEKIRKSVEK